MFTYGKASRDGRVQVHFALPAETGPVSVVGDFNAWDPYAHPMVSKGDGTYSVTVSVPRGEAFAFRYLGDGGRWFDEQDAEEYDHRGAILRAPVPARQVKAAAAPAGRAKTAPAPVRRAKSAATAV
ncbi:isoamylase early set domain-containing protein [Nonomuraea soli]|uniref:Glycoside hydrolase family 13 N-terminal domain-containing protein n=1 Tax=Nonomuraea soli TaxID=1032476 RepID=A0A7W0CV17_9ACTN|nr:isoamylase early set domain-containing protein [Nonomuraea soli]MBA2897868.1 hypothetical protein [Nonomuraea soli]